MDVHKNSFYSRVAMYQKANEYAKRTGEFCDVSQ